MGGLIAESVLEPADRPVRGGDVRLTVAPHPAAIARAQLLAPAGLTVGELVRAAVPDPVFQAHVMAFARGRVVPRAWWDRVRPAPGELLELRVVPHGSGKSPLRIALTIGVIAAAFLAPYALPGAVTATTGFGAAATIGGTSITYGAALSGAVLIGGMLAVNALVPTRPPQLDSLSQAGGSPTLFIEGARNAARPFAPVPVVLGRYRMTPPFGAQPITETVGADQYLRMLFVWGVGPLQIDVDSLRIGDTPIENFEGVEMEHREGFPGEPPITLYGAGGGLGTGGETVFQENLSVTLPDGVARIRSFGTTPPFTGAGLAPYFANASYYFVNPSGGGFPYLDFIDELPEWTTRTSQDDADELSVDWTFPEGLYRLDAEGDLDPVLILIELQFRRVGGSAEFGDNWLGLVQRGNGSIGPADLGYFQQAPGFAYFDVEDPDLYSTFRGFRFTEGVSTGGYYTAAIPTRQLTLPVPLVTGTPIGFLFEIMDQRALRYGVRWRVPERGQYEIRMRKIVRFFEHPGVARKETTVWSALRTIRAGDPIQLGVGTQVPVARTALRIKATGQLNGVIDEFNGVITSYGPIWKGTSWDDDSVFDWEPSNNPAVLFRLVLQGNGGAVPMADDRLDLETIAEWYEFCEDNGLHFNMVRDFPSSIWETLLDVCAAGRASPCQIDGKWSVVIERPQATPVSHVTPRNSFDFRCERAFIDLPHAWRIRFPNEEEDYRQDERRVYADGFDATNATRFEALELPGVTLPEQVQRLGRFRIAQGQAQNERWTFRQDMEFLTYRRGDRISITHDVLQVGLSYGRVTAVEIGTGEEVVGITVDENCPMTAGATFGVAVRQAATGDTVTRQVQTAPGNNRTLVFSAPVGATSGDEASIRVGDLFGFGLLGEETDDGTVVSIMPDADFTARIAAVPYRPAIFDPDVEIVPEFESTLSPLPTIPAPTIRNVQAGQDLLVRGTAAEVRARIAVDFDPLDSGVFGPASVVEVQGRPSGLPQQYAGLTEDQQTAARVVVSGVTAGDSWDLRLRFVVPGRLIPGPWAYVNSVAVLADAITPGSMENLGIAALGGLAYLTWDQPSELDRLLDHEVRFRHSPRLIDDSAPPTWDESTPIGAGGVRFNSRQVVLPLVAGTYLARVFSRRGVPSVDVAMVDTSQVSVLDYVVVASIDEAPEFGGSTDGAATDGTVGVEVGTDLLELSQDTNEVLTPGTYYFENQIDLGSVQSVRLTVRITARSVPTFDSIDERTLPIDLWEDFDGFDQSAAGAYVEARYTPDDPASPGASWSPWNLLSAAEFTARGFQFRAILFTVDPAYNVAVTELGVDAAQVV